MTKQKIQKSKWATFIIGAFLLLTLTGCTQLPDGVSKTEDFNKPDIKDEFCGIQISYQYCKCAFHNQFCDEIGMTKKEADKYVKEEYEKWLSTSRQDFTTNCKAANGFMLNDVCNYCDQGYVANETSCILESMADENNYQEEEELLGELPEGPYNDDCTINKEEFDLSWKKYSDIDNAIEPQDRSYEAQQALASYETMISKLTESFELQRDIEIEEELQANLNEYRQALVQNQKTNLLKVFWRMSWVTYSTIKSGVTAGRSYSNLMTSTGNAVQAIGSSLKSFQAIIPANSDLAIDKSQITGKVASVGAKTAMEAIESLGDPTKVAIRFVKSSADVTLPSANLTEAEINILRQQQIDKGVVDQVLAKSQAANADRQAKLTSLEAEIKTLEAKISEWEAKEKERVAAVLEESCKKLTEPQAPEPETDN